MAKLDVTVDTETGEFSLKVNGTAVENVNSVCVYRSDDYATFEVSCYERVDDYLRSVRLTASEKDGATASKAFPGLFEAPEITEAAKAIAEMYKPRKSR